MGINNFTSFSQVSETEFSIMDTTGITHSVNITRTDGKIESVTYDGVGVSLDYSGNDLVKFDEGDITLIESTNPSGNIGYMANFYIDEDIYYKASCLQNNYISRPPDPTLTSPNQLFNWKYNNTKVSFPYAPSDDVDIYANIVEVRAGMEIYEAETQLFSGTTTVRKKEYGWSIGGYSHSNWGVVFVLVGKTPQSCKIEDASSQSPTINWLVYNDIVYYYSSLYYTGNRTYIENLVDLGGPMYEPTAEEVAVQVLNHYFSQDLNR